jgi:hypothetical protein
MFSYGLLVVVAQGEGAVRCDAKKHVARSPGQGHENGSGRRHSPRGPYLTASGLGNGNVAR